MFKEYLLNMSEYELENQIEQILNYSPNFFSDNKYGIMFMLSIFSNILKEYTTPKDSIPKFSYSINDSIECISSSSLYASYIENLIPNEKNSFILAPLLSSNHLFTCLIHKTDNNYECTVINKGAASNNYAYKKYTIPEKSMESIIPLFGFSYENNFSISDIYLAFSKSATVSEDLRKISSSTQKTNNCYYKEFEAGLKYAYSNSFVDKFTTPKWPISTLEMHQKYLSFILSCNISDYTKKYIKTLYNTYTANKTFKNSLKLTNITNTKAVKRLFSKVFKSNKSNLNLAHLDNFKSAFGYDDSKESTFSALHNCLSLVDLGTLKQHFNFFVNVCKYYKLDEHLFVLDVLKDYMYSKKAGLDKLAPHLKTFFPYATHQLSLEYSHEFNKLGNNFFYKDNLDSAINCFNKAIFLNPNDPSSLLDIGIVYYQKKNYNKALSYYLKALPLTPKSEILIEKIALCHLSLDDTKNLLNDCSKLAKINPNNPNILFFKEQYADKVNKKIHIEKSPFNPNL